MGISIHKAELANCGSSDQSANLQGLDFGTRSQVNNLVASNVSITAQNVVNLGQYYCLWYALHEKLENPVSLTRIPPYKDIIADSALIRENTVSEKPYSRSLSSDLFTENICINIEVIYLFYLLIFNWLVNYGITWFLGFRKPRAKIIMDVLFHWFLEHFWKIFVCMYVCIYLSMYVGELMNCFSGMVDRRKAFSLISSRDHFVRDPHHREPPTRREQGLSLRRDWVQLSWMKLCSSDNHYTTAP